ncbi:MAG: hypothetical protein AAB927_02600, partial [Patescibacteria group bacterium]
PLPQLGTQAAAFTLPPPPPKKPPVAAKYGGNKGKVNVGKMIADGAVCTLGGFVIDKLSDVTPTPLETFGNTIICNGVALIVPGPPGLGGFFGLVATQTICCGSQSIVTKTFRRGGWTCQPQDVGKVAGCKEWLGDHPR